VTPFDAEAVPAGLSRDAVRRWGRPTKSSPTPRPCEPETLPEAVPRSRRRRRGRGSAAVMANARGESKVGPWAAREAPRARSVAGLSRGHGSDDRGVAPRRHAKRRVAATSHQTRPGSIGGAVAAVRARTHAADDPGKAAENTSG